MNSNSFALGVAIVAMLMFVWVFLQRGKEEERATPTHWSTFWSGSVILWLIAGFFIFIPGLRFISVGAIGIWLILFLSGILGIGFAEWSPRSIWLGVIMLFVLMIGLAIFDSSTFALILTMVSK